MTYKPCGCWIGEVMRAIPSAGIVIGRPIQTSEAWSVEAGLCDTHSAKVHAALLEVAQQQLVHPLAQRWVDEFNQRVLAEAKKTPTLTEKP